MAFGGLAHTFSPAASANALAPFPPISAARGQLAGQPAVRLGKWNFGQHEAEGGFAMEVRARAFVVRGWSGGGANRGSQTFPKRRLFWATAAR